MQGIPGSPYGTPGAITCATCGVALSPGSTFCANCGAPVAQTPPASGAWPPAGQPGQPAYPPAGYPPAGYPPAGYAQPGSLPSGAGGSWPSGPSNPTNPPTQPTLNPPRPASSSLTGPVAPQSPGGGWPTGPVPYPPPASAQPPAGWPGAPMPGQPVPGAYGGWQAPSTTPFGAPNAGNEWSNTKPGATAGMGGMAGLAGSPIAQPPAKPKSRRALITTIAAVCIVALLGGGAYWAFATFLNPSHQLETARYVPSTTFAYGSVDLVALGNNSHHYSFSNPSPSTAQTENAATQSALGLNFTTDILPWLGRDISFGAWPGSGGGGSSVEGAALIQSRDDNAASAAVNKALAHLGQQGQQFTTSSYGNFTLHASGDSATGVIATGSGQVIIASTVSAAHTVIDRINGQSDALSSNSAFQSATSNLPSDRYGTIYLNFRALASASGASGSLPSTFLNIYPTAVSYLEWTQAGIRWQTALKAAQSGAPAASLSGDATSLAAMVPQNASVFAGVSNLGGLVQSFDALGGASGGSDPLQAALGVPSTDTSLQQGAAIAAFGGDASSSLGSSGAFLIHEPSAANANSLLTALENQANNAAGYQVIQLVPTQVGSVSATNIESTDGRGLPFGLGGSSTTTASDGNY